jgi:hypothetical protein
VSQLKQVFGLLGLIVALAGIALGNQVLVWVAIGLLGVSIVVRMLIAERTRKAEREEPRDTDGEEPGATT